MQGPLLGEYVDQSACSKPVGHWAVSMFRDERVEIGRDGQRDAVLALRGPSGGCGDPAGLSRAADGEAPSPVGFEESGVVE